MNRTLLKLSVALTLAALAGCDDRTWAESGAASTVTARASEALEPPAKAAPEAPTATTTPAQAEKPAADEPEKRVEPEADRDAPLGIKRLVVAHGVKGREPVGAAEQFAKEETDRIYAFVEVANPERAHSEIFVSFQREGEVERGAIRLSVGPSPRWRTWAFTRLANQPGRYQVVVRDAAGKEIGRASFEVLAEGTAPAV